MGKIKVKIVNESTNQLPEYKHQGDSGIDLRAYINGDNTKIIYKAEVTEMNGKDCIIMQPMGRICVDTGIRVSPPEGVESMVRPRSGLSRDHGIVAMIGTVDNGYRGTIGVTLINFGEKAFVINDGDRIAQLVFGKYETAEFEVVEQLDDTERGSGGFNSTGIK